MATLLTVREAALQFRTSPDTLYRLLAQGKLTKHQREQDRMTFLDVDELEQAFRPKPVEERSDA